MISPVMKNKNQKMKRVDLKIKKKIEFQRVQIRKSTYNQLVISKSNSNQLVIRKSNYNQLVIRKSNYNQLVIRKSNHSLNYTKSLSLYCNWKEIKKNKKKQIIE